VTERANTVFSRVVAAVTGGGLVSLLRTRTIVVLVLLLLALVAGIELARPGTVNALWASNMLLFAAPLGIVAAGQTLVMLTGGIDLSVANVATASAYLMATHSGLGVAPAILYGLGVGIVVGLINGIGVALLRVQPLVMTLGTGLMTEGILVVYSQKKMADAPRVPQFIEDLGAGKSLGGIPNDLIVWVPIAIVLIFVLRRTGYGRLLYAIGDNSKACRLEDSPAQLCHMRPACSSRRSHHRWRHQLCRTQAGRGLPPAVRGRSDHRRNFDLRRPRRIFGHHRRSADPDRAEQHSYLARRARVGSSDPLWHHHPPSRSGLHPPDKLINNPYGKTLAHETPRTRRRPRPHGRDAR